MPRLSYRASRAIRFAAPTIRSRKGGVSDGLGATSISFWLRRWIVHSRSPKWLRPP